MTCSWAACHQPATGVADNWPMCRPHLELHLEMAAEETPVDLPAVVVTAPPRPTIRTDDLIRLRWREGRTDQEIAVEIGVYPEQVRGRRRAMWASAPPKDAAPPKPAVFTGTSDANNARRCWWCGSWAYGAADCKECTAPVKRGKRYARRGRRAA